MKPKQLAAFLACLACQFASSILAHAGQTVMSTGDSAPLYPTSGVNKNTEVVIGTVSNQTSVTNTVTLTTTSNDGGPVYVTYTPSSGMTEVSDTGWGTSQEAVTYSFLSSCIGSVNTVSISVSHDSTDLSVCSTGVSTGYTICIPYVSITADPGGLTNSYNGYYFNRKATVTGIDDPSQIAPTQVISATTTQVNTVTGYTASVGTGVPWNTGGSYELDTRYNEPASPPMSGTPTIDDDEQSWLPLKNPAGTVTSGGTTYQWSYQSYTALDCKFYLERVAGAAVLVDALWGYKWDNYNDTWPSPGAPTFYGYTAYGGIVGASPAGEFYGTYGITGL